MQIACQRFSCQKAVEVCYWSCKFRGKCKDWQKALTGEPGLVAIQSRLESAAAKTGRAFDPQTLASPARAKSRTHPLAKTSGSDDQPATVALPVPVNPNKTLAATVDAAAAHPIKRKVMNNTEDKKPAKPVTRPKATNGALYLLLQKTGKYKELREQDLAAQAPLLLKDKTLRLVKGQLLRPTISFTTNEE
ncbi:MAG: hypothetical protein HOP19_00295 [Acidobacteria bacterium]|nr:hypothetical protein [Acidobacteriota bacterium]